MTSGRIPLKSKLVLKRELEMTATTKRSLLDVRKTLQPNWYRCPIYPVTFRELMVPCDFKGWLQAGAHLEIFVLLTA